MHCCFSADQPQRKWEDARKFISNCINKSGSLLDVGCANGFLLKSLTSWSSQEITPYGIDILDKNIQNAKELFPDYQDNFICCSYDNFLGKYPETFPNDFDFIIWSFWDDQHKISKEEIEYLLSHVNGKGKLIITFYPDNSKEPTDIIGNIPRVKEMGYQTENIKNNVAGRNEQLIVIQK